jgi:hypothetical protein
MAFKPELVSDVVIFYISLSLQKQFIIFVEREYAFFSAAMHRPFAHCLFV